MKLEHACAELSAKLENEQTVASELRRSLDQKALEFESARKNMNRDRPFTVVSQEATSPTSSRYDQSSKEEIKGLK